MKVLVVGPGGRRRADHHLPAAGPPRRRSRAARQRRGGGSTAKYPSRRPWWRSRGPGRGPRGGRAEAPLVAGARMPSRGGDAGLRPVPRGRPRRGLQGVRQEVMAAAGAPTARAVATSDLGPVRRRVARPAWSRTTGWPRARRGGHGRPRARRGPRPRVPEHQQSVLVEEFLDGPEVSLFVLSDGAHVVPAARAA
ncbi:hypothetical protein QJS66_18320 [Kocuria rhizophila]|nr:hypothetical protein QJS66_18320 [Kocuria rhizophila]